jgi:hypothetical protein
VGCTGSHGFAGKGAPEEGLRGELALKKPVHRHGSGDGAGCAPPHTGGQRESLPKLEFNPLGGAQLREHRQSCGTCGVLEGF